MDSIRSIASTWHGLAQKTAANPYGQAVMQASATLGTGYLVFGTVSRQPRAIAAGMLVATIMLNSPRVKTYFSGQTSEATARIHSLVTGVLIASLSASLLARSQGHGAWNWLPLPSILMNQASRVVSAAQLLSTAALGTTCVLALNEASSAVIKTVSQKIRSLQGYFGA